MFYREAGSRAAPAVVLLHGTPASSHQYRNLIPALADRYHVIAPDYSRSRRGRGARICSLK
jgi:pimeloyl-ACP methyl ester carboxylesterase